MSTKKSQSDNNILDRLKTVYKYKSDVQLADKLGVRQSVVANWRSRNSANLELIISKCDDINLNWLFRDEGPMRIGGEGNDVGAPSEFYSIPFYANVKASAGHGLVGEDISAPLTIKFRRHFVNNTLKAAANDLIGMLIKGDSMNPVLKDGDLIIVNRAATKPDQNMFAVRIDDEVYVKYIQRVPGNKLQLISANETYPPLLVDPADYNFQILGKVVHLSRTLH